MSLTDFDFSGSAEEIFHRCADQKAKLAEARTRAIARWRWATNSMYDPRPHGLLLTSGGGQWLDDKKVVGPYSYGIAEDGTILVERRNTVVNGADVVNRETLYFYPQGRVVSIVFGSARDGLLSVAIKHLQEGRPEEYSAYSTHPYAGTSDERYNYDGGTLLSTTGHQTNFGKAREWTHEFEYDDQGNLSKIVGHFSDSGTHVVYHKPPPNRATLKADAVQRSQQLLFDAAGRTIERFYNDHAGEVMYAFAFVAPAEGTGVSCAIATEERLAAVADDYLASGYEAREGDSRELLQQALRWSDPEDVWYEYALEDAGEFLATLSDAFNSAVFELYDNTASAICMQTLERLDSADTFGSGADREAIVIGFTHGEDIAEFVSTASDLNPDPVVSRLIQEVARGGQAATLFVPE